MDEILNNPVENVQDDAANLKNLDTQAEQIENQEVNNDSVENVQDDAANEQKFYKSQEEVDRAFAKRLERERRKIEKELIKKYEKELSLASEVKRILGNEDIEKAIENLKEKRIEQMAEELGLTYEAAKKIFEIENKNVQPVIEKNVDDSYIETLLEQENEIKKEFPDFDLVKAMDEDEDFAKMIANGIPVKKAFYASRFDEIYPRLEKQIEEKIVERIKNRNQIPSTMTKQTQAQPQIDISKFTAEQLNELAERARRGERIIL